jgi:nitrate/nitrite transport system ATP-binding protein
MLLLDEPFGALDALTRGVIQDELVKICAATQQTVFMITHDVDEAILLADTVLLMSNGPQARIGEVVRNPLPRSRQRATLHHEPLFYAMRNHLVDFLVSRSKTLSHGRAPEHPPQVSPGVDAGTAITPTPLTPSDPSLRAVLQRVV